MAQGVADFPLAERPQLRPIEAFPVEDRGQRFIVLRDPSDSEVSPLTLSNGAVPLLTLLDGQRTVDGIHAALQLRGASLSLGEIHAFLRRLDEAGYLEGPRAQHRLERRRSSFRARPLRAAVYAGGAYPDGLAELPQFLAAGFLHRDGPGALPAARKPNARPLRGVVAPHVDLHRGAPTYSWAYRALAEAHPADLYVILGTCHTGVDGTFAATLKPYDTPLGAAPTDPDFLGRVERLWGSDLWQGEFSHANEHSIEFQAVYLRSLRLVGDRGGAIAPILCDSLHSLVPHGRSPREVGIVSDFVGALRRAIAEDGRRITVIAAVDLAHVGKRFGDTWDVDRMQLARVKQDDLETLDYIARGDAQGYYSQVMRDGDARRICGLTPLYLLTELMGGDPVTPAGGDLLRYTQWADRDGSSSVTFASMVFR